MRVALSTDPSGHGLIFPEDHIDAPFYHMQIEEVRGHRPSVKFPHGPNWPGPVHRPYTAVSVTTTGAEYTVTAEGIELVRRIDPSTNGVAPRPVALMRFPALPMLRSEHVGIGPYNKRSGCVTVGSILRLEFKSDSLFFLKNVSRRVFRYRYHNLVENAPWNKQDPMRGRMWTDGNGGSLLAFVDQAQMTIDSDDVTTITVQPGGIVAHMVFPPRAFDFDALYGEGRRPFRRLIGNKGDGYDQLRTFATGVAEDQTSEDPNADLRETLILWNHLYENHSYCGSEKCRPFPRPLPEGYVFTHPEEIKEAVFLLHNAALPYKLIAYMTMSENSMRDRPGFPQWHTVEETLEWIEQFGNEYELDGYYLDYAGYGDIFADNWFATYRFIRGLRHLVGDDGLIRHHNSVDVWGAHSGLRAVMVDAYSTVQLAGESFNSLHGRNPDAVDTAVIDHPDENYLRFFTSGYGLSQAIADHVMVNRRTGALSRDEKLRVLLQNVNGVAETLQGDTRAIYAARKDAWNRGEAPPIEWPPAWYSRMFDGEIAIELTNADRTLSVSWTTPEPTNSSVAFSDADGRFFLRGTLRWEGPVWNDTTGAWDWTEGDLLAASLTDIEAGKTRDHRVELPVSDEGTHLRVELPSDSPLSSSETTLSFGETYRLRIRASNEERFPKIFGYVENFSVTKDESSGELTLVRDP